MSEKNSTTPTSSEIFLIYKKKEARDLQIFRDLNNLIESAQLNDFEEGGSLSTSALTDLLTQRGISEPELQQAFLKKFKSNVQTRVHNLRLQTPAQTSSQ